MTAPTPDGDDAFLALASQKAMLTDTTVQELLQEAASRGVAASHLAMEKGLMDPLQVEVVETLLRPSDLVPGYEILDVLGSGGMGVVYRARQTNLNRVVALKTVRVGLGTLPGTLARFEKEAHTVGQLRHPNIVAAYDFGKHQGRLYFAMELVEGEELGTLIDRKGRLDERTAWGLARQIASGLSQATRAGVVHRDIKPANILLVDPPEGFAMPDGLPMVKITDFGLAFLSHDGVAGDRLTVAGTTLGTPLYMAPEQFENSGVDLRADLYALGATVFHMLTGKPPFHQQPLSAVIAGKLNGDAPTVSEFVPHASKGTVELVAAMMARKLGDRIPDYVTLVARIDRLLAALPTQDQVNALAETSDFPAAEVPSPGSIAPTAGLPTTVQGPRRRWLWSAGAAVTAAMVAGMYFGALSLSGSRPLADEPTLVPGDWSRYLYDGESLRGWRIVDGQWSRAQDEEGGRVLAGRGCIACSLERQPPLQDYRLLMAVSRQAAGAVELHFAIQPEARGESPRYVLRWTANDVQVGRRRSTRIAFEALAPAVPAPVDDPSAGLAYHEMRVERHGTHWRALFDGSSVAILPLPRGKESAEFQLVTEGGPAWFDAVQVMELVAAPQPVAATP